MKNMLTCIICLMSFGFTQCQNENTCGKLFKEIDGDGFVCISQDSLSFVANKAGYYFGPYILQDSTIIPNKNIFSNRSYNIFTDNCDSSTMEGSVFWNGMDNNGNRVPVGVYVVVTEVFNFDGTVKKFKNGVVVATR